jgi:hypothetical protein
MTVATAVSGNRLDEGDSVGASRDCVCLCVCVLVSFVFTMLPHSLSKPKFMKFHEVMKFHGIS